MCFMDWRIGRLIRSKTTTIATNGSGVFTLAANASRVGLTVWCSANGFGCQILSDGIATGPVLGGSQSSVLPNHITLATHGDLPTRQLNIVSQQGAADTVVFTEYFAPEAVLALGLEQIREQYPKWGIK